MKVTFHLGGNNMKNGYYRFDIYTNKGLVDTKFDKDEAEFAYNMYVKDMYDGYSKRVRLVGYKQNGDTEIIKEISK